MRIAVTGAGGFLGGRLARRLAADGHVVLALDRQMPEVPAGGQARGCDITDAASVHDAFAAFAPDAVVHLAALLPFPYALGFNDICNTNNQRSLISAMVPKAAFGNKIPILVPDSKSTDLFLLLANLNSIICDYVARQKIQSRNLNKYILEQLPIVPPNAYEKVAFGLKTAAEIIREAVLELTYTSNDLAAFARDMNYVSTDGSAKLPFVWDERRRLTLRAKLDALFFHLYGISDRDDVRYIYSTFPIVEREETKRWGHYASRDLCLAWMNALKAGRPDETIELPG
jgi:NAD dependent epimerase/dehydratase family